MRLKSKADGKNGSTIKPIILAAAVLAGSMSLLYAMVVTKSSVATPQDKRQPTPPPAAPAKDKAEFCPADSVITGFSLPVDKSDIEKTVTVTVCPKEKADKVKFRIEGEDRVDVKVTKIDEDTGKIEIEVKGKSATPKDKPDGDTTIDAKLDDDIIGKVQVIVVVPTTQKQTPGKLTLVNDAQNLGSNQATIKSTAECDFKITIYDQFDKVLDDIYNSSDKVVAESWSETHLSSGFVSPYNGLFGNLNAGVTIDPCRLQCSLIDFPAWSDTQIKKWKAIKLEYPPDGNPQRNNVFAFLIANGNPLNPIKFNAVQTITCYGFQLTPNYLLEMKTLDNDYPPVPAIIKKKSE